MVLLLYNSIADSTFIYKPLKIAYIFTFNLHFIQDDILYNIIS